MINPRCSVCIKIYKLNDMRYKIILDSYFWVVIIELLLPKVMIKEVDICIFSIYF